MKDLEWSFLLSLKKPLIVNDILDESRSIDSQGLSVLRQFNEYSFMLVGPDYDNEMNQIAYKFLWAATPRIAILIFRGRSINEKSLGIDRISRIKSPEIKPPSELLIDGWRCTLESFRNACSDSGKEGAITNIKNGVVFCRWDKVFYWFMTNSDDESICAIEFGPGTLGGKPTIAG